MSGSVLVRWLPGDEVAVFTPMLEDRLYDGVVTFESGVTTRVTRDEVEVVDFGGVVPLIDAALVDPEPDDPDGRDEVRAVRLGRLDHGPAE